MGKVEKWVVLGVLALIVGILVVSLTVDDPLKKDDVVRADGSAASRSANEGRLAGGVPPAKLEAAGGSAPSALLNSSISSPVVDATPVAPAAPVVEAIPAGSILKSMEGLEESYMSDTRFYEWKSGDTFPALAQRFYGDLARLATLRRVNEGRTDVQPGDRVLIPVFDPDLPQSARVQPAPAGSTPLASAKGLVSPDTKSGAVTAKPVATGARVHLVKEGESLWVIAKQELGNGARWKEIYDANRDQLSSPEALHTGIKLRLP
jgi:nucleoid-associated protein YgaU